MLLSTEVTATEVVPPPEAPILLSRSVMEPGGISADTRVPGLLAGFSRIAPISVGARAVPSVASTGAWLTAVRVTPIEPLAFCAPVTPKALVSATCSEMLSLRALSPAMSSELV